MNVAYTIVEAPPGPIYAAELHNGLFYIGLGEEGYADLVAFARRWIDQPRIMPSVIDATIQLTEYVEGSRRDFDLPLLTYGTDFQKQVWEALRAIPYGQTRTYGQVAQAVKRPSSQARAVGQACAANPMPLVVPCHRVLAAGGKLGGYSGGLEWKKWLLELESAKTAS